MDTLQVRHATGDDAVAMGYGSHYDYQSQRWVDGHDHAHCGPDDSRPLMFCGVDFKSCTGSES